MKRGWITSRISQFHNCLGGARLSTIHAMILYCFWTTATCQMCSQPERILHVVASSPTCRQRVIVDQAVNASCALHGTTQVASFGRSQSIQTPQEYLFTRLSPPRYKGSSARYHDRVPDEATTRACSLEMARGGLTIMSVGGPDSFDLSLHVQADFICGQIARCWPR